MITFLKIISSALIVAIMFVAGYFNMVWTWGVELKSVTSFFGFFILTLFLHVLLGIIGAIKDE